MKRDITLLIAVITFVRGQVHRDCFGGASAVGADNKNTDNNAQLDQLIEDFNTDM